MIYSAIVCLSFEKFTQNAPKLCSQKQIRTKVYHNNQLENDSYSKWQFTWKCYCFNFLFSYISWELLGLTFLWIRSGKLLGKWRRILRKNERWYHCVEKYVFSLSKTSTQNKKNIQWNLWIADTYRTLKNLSIIKRSPLLGGSLAKIVTIGTKHFVRYWRHVRYLGCPLLGGFTV